MTEKKYSALGHTGNSALDAMLKSRHVDNDMQTRPDYAPESKPEYEKQDIVSEIDDNLSLNSLNTETQLNSREFYNSNYSDNVNDVNPKPAKKTGKKSGKASKKSTKNNKKGKKIAIGVGSVAAALCLATVGYTYLYPNIHFGVKAGTVEIGGMTLDEAQKEIDKSNVLDDAELPIEIYQTEYKINAAEVADGLDSENSAQNAYNSTRTGGFFSRIANTVKALFGAGESPLSVNVNSQALSAKLSEISTEALTEPVDPFWTVEGDYLVVDKGSEGVSFDTDKLYTQVENRIKNMDFSTLEVDVETTEQNPIDVQYIYDNAQTQAKNATVDKTDGTTILPSVDGVKFDLETAKEIIGDGSEQTYKIPIERTPADVTAEQLAQVLFRDTLASTSTKLDSSNKSRTNNVRLASQFINGTILNPGDEFSYNNVVGERTVSRGFQTAGAYSNGQVIEDVGGGVCQPSSTIYMAVLRADLEVTERHNHSLTVSYTPLGEDATVSWGGPDFRFKNNTDYPVKILAWQEGNAMYVKILGTKTTDKVVKTNTEVTETINYETVEKVDSSLSPGQKETSQSGITGYKTVTYKIITENGQTTTVKANTSYYKSRDKIVLVGPAATPEQSSSSNTSTGNTETTENTETPAVSENTDPEAE